jgi:hypothetical protein
MPFWRACLQCHLTSRSRSGIAKASASFTPAIALDPPDDVVGRGIEVRPAAMTVEFEFLAMRGHRRHDGFRGSLSAFEGRGGQNAAHDHARVHVPRLRLKADLDGDASSPAWSSRSSSLPKALTENGQVGSRNTSKTRGPWSQTSGSARHAFMRSFLYPVQFAVRARSGVGAGLLKLPQVTTKCRVRV